MKKIALLSLLLPLISACWWTGDENYRALRERNIQCPAGAELRYSTWGTHGLTAHCVILHGPYASAKNGKVVVDGGEYNMGKISKEGVWLDESGRADKKTQR